MRFPTLLVCCAILSIAAAAPAVPQENLAGFRRGVNLSHWYAQSLDGRYDEERLATYITPDDFRLIRSMGFDHVRLTLDDSVLFDPVNPGTLKPEPLAKFDGRLRGLLDAGLNVVVDLHPGDEYKRRLHEPTAANAFVADWGALARHLVDTDPARVWLEVLNEPQDHWPTEQWRPLQERAVKAIRSAAPKHTIVCSGGGWGGIDPLLTMTPYDVANVVYTAHWYEPHLFTHQSAEWGWNPARHVRGLPWPVSPERAATVTAEVTRHAEATQHLRWQIENGWFGEAWARAKFDELARWQQRHGGVPVYMGEFGVYAKACPPESRQAWSGFCAAEFGRRGWGWAIWDYAGGFAVVSGETGGKRRGDQALQRQLGLDRAISMKD